MPLVKEVKALVVAQQKEDDTPRECVFVGRGLSVRDRAKKAPAEIAREGGPRATHVYNRYGYDREKQVALATWARTLTAIIENKPAKVRPFVRA